MFLFFGKIFKRLVHFSYYECLLKAFIRDWVWMGVLFIWFLIIILVFGLLGLVGVLRVWGFVGLLLRIWLLLVGMLSTL